MCAVHDGYKVGSDLSVSLEFQTSQSEGVFLGISSAKVDAIGLEMIGGHVSSFLGYQMTYFSLQQALQMVVLVYNKLYSILDLSFNVPCKPCSNSSSPKMNL